jgi:hypothetical protein
MATAHGHHEPGATNSIVIRSLRLAIQDQVGHRHGRLVS